MQSGSCATQTRATAQAASLAFAKAGRLPGSRRPPRPACAPLPEQTLLDASASYQPLFTSGGPELPVPAAQAVASGHYNRVPLLIGTNHNEGRTFAQGFTGLTQEQAAQLITSEFGSRAAGHPGPLPVVLLPEPVHRGVPDRRHLDRQRLPDRDRRLPGAEPGRPVRRDHADVLLPVRRPARARAQQRPPRLPVGRRARHGAGLPVAQLQQRLSRCTTCSPRPSSSCPGRWSGTGAPSPPPARPRPAASRCWPRYTSGQLMSLRPGDQTRTIPAGTFAAEHQCSFWDSAG